jgi:hypothetical protein
MLIPLALTLVAPVLPADEVRITATLDATEMTVGGAHEIRLEIVFPESVVASEAGVPAPLLQLDVPPSVKLTGKTLTTLKELRANEFIAEPYERLLEDTLSAISFELVSAPAEGATIGLNVIAYVSAGDGSEPVFMRRRLELSLSAGASAVEATEPNSRWGNDKALLQIGDQLQPFKLPLADGYELSIAEWIGQSNIILTTYRAHW